MIKSATKSITSLLATALFSVSLVAAFCVAGSGAASAQATKYPDKPIRWIVPFPPGGLSDNVTRVMAQALQNELSQSVIVENRVGAAGLIGTEYVVRGPADGYMLLTVAISNLSLPRILRPDLAFDPAVDLEPVSNLTVTPWVLVARKNLPANNFKELVAYAKANPGKLNFGSSGLGGGAHIHCELLKLRAGIEMTHVPYSGATPAMKDMMGGQIDLYCADYVSWAKMISGPDAKLKAIVALGEKRTEKLPDLLSLKESGVDKFEINPQWIGVAVRGGTPKEIIVRIKAAIDSAMTKPETIAQLKKMNADMVQESTESFKKMVEAERVLYGDIVKSSGIKFQ